MKFPGSADTFAGIRLERVPEQTVQAPLRRPALVTVIFWFHVLAVLAVAWFLLRLATGGVRTGTPTAFYASAVVIIATVKMWGAAALYKLRRSAVSIFLVAVLLNLPFTVYDIYRHPRGYQLVHILGMVSGVVILGSVCLYSLYLARLGTLH